MNLKESLNTNKQLNLRKDELEHEIKVLKEQLSEKESQLSKLLVKQYKLQQDINNMLTIKLGDLVNGLATSYNTSPTVTVQIIFKKPVIVNYFKAKKQVNTNWRMFSSNDYKDANLKIEINMNDPIFKNKTENAIFEFIRPFNLSNFNLEKLAPKTISRTLPNGYIEHTGLQLIGDISQINIDFTIDDISKTSNNVSENYKTINPIQKGLKYTVADIVAGYEKCSEK